MYKNAARFAQRYLEKTGKLVSDAGPANSNRKRKAAAAKVASSSNVPSNVENNGKSKLRKPKNRSGKKRTPQVVIAIVHMQTEIKPTAMEMAFFLAKAKLKSNDNN
ncbi:hypothetical protein [Thiobacter aerophilum]|uniref:Uncharacterized protein n=1 Tax=Thiobacter aerophilum TaxID=3121275 RepID=A0ABV0EGP3_9BURK